MVYTGHKPLKQVTPATKSFLKSSSYLYTSALCTVISSLLYYLFFNYSDHIFFDSKHKTTTSFYTDAADKGQSTLLKTWSNGNVIGMECMLKEGFPFPYSGFELSQNSEKFLDLSAYNRMEVQISTQNLEHLYVYLTLQDEKVKNQDNRLALRRVLSDLKVKSGTKQLLCIPLEKFVTPDWWYSVVNQPKSDFIEPDLKKVKSVILSTGVNPKLNEPVSIKVHSIRFYRDNTWVILSMILLQGLVMLGLYKIHTTSKRKHSSVTQQPLFVTYRAIETKEANKTKTGYRFLDYIHENYTNPELGLMQISKEMGISHRNISDTISEKFGCNIKTYINQIRIHESKRLLAQSNLKVSEIAYQVGFNSPVNFNRVFKSFTGISPTEYIQQKEKSV